MWIVKLGGSLCRDPAGPLPQWLELLTTLGRGRVVVVPGGGGFADEARRAQAAWGVDDLAAHNMAVLGMAQGAFLLRGLAPALQPCLREVDIRRALRAGRTALWLPLELLREQPDELTSWDVTSDSLALWLAGRLHAERLLVVKSCAVPPGASLQALSQAGILDAAFAQRAAGAGCAIDVAPSGALEDMRAALVGAGCGAVGCGDAVG